MKFYQDSKYYELKNTLAFCRFFFQMGVANFDLETRDVFQGRRYNLKETQNLFCTNWRENNNMERFQIVSHINGLEISQELL